MISDQLRQKIIKYFEEEHIFYGEEQIQNIKSEIAYINKFKISWFATQLKIYLSIAILEKETITLEMVKSYSEDFFNYVKNKNKGRGLQSGFASVSILASEKIDFEAKVYCENFAKTRWAAFQIPVVVDLATGELSYFRKKPIWGFIYYNYIKEIIIKNCKCLIKG